MTLRCPALYGASHASIHAPAHRDNASGDVPKIQACIWVTMPMVTECFSLVPPHVQSVGYAAVHASDASRKSGHEECKNRSLMHLASLKPDASPRCKTPRASRAVPENFSPVPYCLSSFVFGVEICKGENELTLVFSTRTTPRLFAT
jgi:hypothetical protein